MLCDGMDARVVNDFRFLKMDLQCFVRRHG